MNEIVPIWKTRVEILDHKGVEIIRNAQFSLDILQQTKTVDKKLIELIVRRWTASGYWLDLFLLGKGRRNEYPLNLPGVKAEEGWAKVLKALFDLCILCHDYHSLKHSYHWPIHLWLAVVDDMVQQDINSALKGDQLKTATLKGNRNFIRCLKKRRMPSREDWGGCGDHSYRLFKTAFAIDKRADRTPDFVKFLAEFISKYDEDTTAYDHNDRAKAVFVEAGVLKVRIDKRSQATGWKTLQLPPLSREFWSSHQGVLISGGHTETGVQQ
jgi:hypothetical protein